jgi:thiol-disulfide isomerase/thioredoxin
MTLSALLMISAVTAAPGYQGVLLDFSATWCGPCQRVKPVVKRLERQGYPIRTVDIDREPALARRFGIHGVPTFVLVVNGKEAQRLSGGISEATMRQMMARIPTAALAKSTGESDAPESLYASPKRNETRAKRKRFRLPFSREKDDVAARKSPPSVIRANNDAADKRPAGSVPNDPMVASVRIRVRDSQGINYGSGTVIDSRAGRSLVLTCGHIFRGVPKNTVAEVDRFDGTKATTYRGRILAYDLKADVGLMSIATDDPVPTARLAPPDGGPQRGDSLVGIGCGGGKRPLKIPVRVTGVNVYLGPGNLECTGMPQQGRSGGGLFDQSGRLVGVCFAAEPKNRRGLYASLRPIHALLKYAKVQIRDSKAESPETQLAAAKSPPTTQGSSENPGMSDQLAGKDLRGSFADAVATSQGSSENPEMTAREAIQIDQRQLALMQVPLRRGSASRGTEAGDGKSGPFPPVKSDDDAPAAAAGLRAGPPLKQVDDVFGKPGEAEVICVIRRLDDPRAPSKVIIINRASAKLVRYLQNEIRVQPRKTSRFVQQATYESRKPREELTTPFRMVSGDGAIGNETGRYRRSRASRVR